MTELELIEFEFATKCGWCAGSCRTDSRGKWCIHCGGSGLKCTESKKFFYSIKSVAEPPPYLDEDS